MPATCTKEFALHVSAVSLQAYWAFEEASQPWLDSTGKNHPLVNTNFFAATSTPGKIALGAELKGGTTLSRFASSTDLVKTNGAFTMFGWVRVDTSLVAAAPMSVFMFNPSAVDIQRSHVTSTAGNFALTAVGELAETVDTGVPWALGQTYFLVMWFDPGTKKFNLQIDNGIITSSAGIWVPSATIASSNTRFSAPFATGLPYGMIDEAGLWNGPLSSSQRSALYNGGAGLTWPNVDNV